MSGVYLLKGSDPVLLAEAARETVRRLVGDDDGSEVVDELSGDDYELGSAVMAATTMSMFGDRVIVARNCGRFGAEDLAPVYDYLEDPSPDSSLVLVWDKPLAAGARTSAVPKKLTDAVKAAGGEVIETGVPGGKGRTMWVDDVIGASSVRLSNRAKRELVDRLGEDVNRLGGILTVLEANFGAGAGPLEPDDIEPFVGAAGSVPPWELTDAIDEGRVADSVRSVQRMVGGGGRHPLQVMVTLTTHVERMLRLDGSGAVDERDAANVLGMKGSTFPAKKALAQARRLGSDRLRRAITLVADADVDLRGRTDRPGEQVLEVLVARLANLSAGARSRR
ncbi:MAG: DNA polymerase III subunit delta [Acidimicrobiales bacterium]